MDRSSDWLKQAERDLDQARLSLREGFYEWACFAAQQSAEKAVKALCEKHNVIIRTHQLMGLMKALNDFEDITDEVYQKGVVLDRFYIPTR
jgi:HEPN domain-containing protein